MPLYTLLAETWTASIYCLVIKFNGLFSSRSLHWQNALNCLPESLSISCYCWSLLRQFTTYFSLYTCEQGMNTRDLGGDCIFMVMLAIIYAGRSVS